MKQERNMFIVHCHDLNQDIERYKEMFPDSYTSYDSVKERLQTRMDDPVGAKFGIEVSSEWQDKCFGFEVDKQTPRTTHFVYLGTWKT